MRSRQSSSNWTVYRWRQQAYTRWQGHCCDTFEPATILVDHAWINKLNYHTVIGVFLRLYSLMLYSSLLHRAEPTTRRRRAMSLILKWGREHLLITVFQLFKYRVWRDIKRLEDPFICRRKVVICGLLWFAELDYLNQITNIFSYLWPSWISHVSSPYRQRKYNSVHSMLRYPGIP